MSDDGIWCKKDKSIRRAVVASYTLLPINHKHASSKCADDRSSVNFIQNLRQHRNRKRINRDIRNIRRTCSDSNDSDDDSFTHTSSLQYSRSHRLLSVCLILALHIICNEFVTSVNCDELIDSAGARSGHFTHTWAVHIPGGDEEAERVAHDHDMYLRGKVSEVQLGPFFLQSVFMNIAIKNWRRNDVARERDFWPASGMN